ncbi:uncharacterized protein PHACADRAFT_33444 [Phanerochaete carnosa HHB-10118-sp]|uniref:Ubiquitin-like protease family profile domain-containing protein n=1 Tax=Phanerochaete carnosa (strain HHB-10118-sp) TaxID=650164 RepID=K5UIN0_PHACS|nr:uncharacterized protein PHACADRAFT_33444 [Phanerochaete carnosa HHB-10118-sp]EKM49366.1 hypothetical protein PHACADRAFT_33444 [Phanerochaete carnosa HHB-10118-sp]
MLSFWLTQSHAWVAQSKWAESGNWHVELYNSGHRRTASAAEAALETFPKLSWDTCLMGTCLSPGIAVQELQPLLADSMLSSNIIDAMILGICRDLQDISTSACIEIHDLTVFETLRKSPDEWHNYHSSRSFSALRTLGSQITSCTIDRLYLPLNVRGNYWALFIIKPMSRHVHYGDSLGRPFKGDNIHALQHWLGQHCSSSWNVDLNVPIVVQPYDDNFSCGILIINTIRHDLFEQPLWTEKTRELLRVTEYLHLVDDHLLALQVSLLSDVENDNEMPEDTPSSTSPPKTCSPDAPKTTSASSDTQASTRSKASHALPVLGFLKTCRQGKAKPSAKKLTGKSKGFLAFSGFVVNSSGNQERQLEKLAEESKEHDSRFRQQVEEIEAKKLEHCREQDRR